jgi:hypothetical protein
MQVGGGTSLQGNSEGRRMTSQPTTPLLSPAEAVALDLYNAELAAVRHCIREDWRRVHVARARRIATSHLPVLLAATEDVARALDTT